MRQLRQWNKQTLVKHYRLVLSNGHEIIQWLHKYLNGSEILIALKLTELWRSCFFRPLVEFLDLYLKSVREKSVYKECCFLKRSEKQN